MLPQQNDPNFVTVSLENMSNQWLYELSNTDTRNNALSELSNKWAFIPDLTPKIRFNTGAMSAIVQEIINIYTELNKPELTVHQSLNACNALNLVQSLALHQQTRLYLIQSHLVLLLKPFLYAPYKSCSFEHLRLKSLNIIEILVSTNNEDIITYLLSRGFLSLCLDVMETGTEISKIAAGYVLQNMLLLDCGLNFVCQAYDHYMHINLVLGKIVLSLAENLSARLLSLVVRIYYRLSEHPVTRDVLRHCLPDQLLDRTFITFLQEDHSVMMCIIGIICNLVLKP